MNKILIVGDNYLSDAIKKHFEITDILDNYEIIIIPEETLNYRYHLIELVENNIFSYIFNVLNNIRDEDLLFNLIYICNRYQITFININKKNNYINYFYARYIKNAYNIVIPEILGENHPLIKKIVEDRIGIFDIDYEEMIYISQDNFLQVFEYLFLNLPNLPKYIKLDNQKQNEIYHINVYIYINTILIPLLYYKIKTKSEDIQNIVSFNTSLDATQNKTKDEKKENLFFNFFKKIKKKIKNIKDIINVLLR